MRKQLQILLAELALLFCVLGKCSGAYYAGVFTKSGKTYLSLNFHG